ncbi:MAG: HAMP domain-containing histidine kinase [Firmicutes bacterium]|nr:HAMP domain-containing histidine kinase [Bacillota bacterium]
MTSRARWIYSIPMKIAAYVLSLLCIVTVTIGAEFLIMWQDGYYSPDVSNSSGLTKLIEREMKESAKWVLEEPVWNYVFWNDALPRTQVVSSKPISLEDYEKTGPVREAYPALYDVSSTNLRYRIMMGDVELPISTYQGEAYSHECKVAGNVPIQGSETVLIEVECFLLEPMAVKDYFTSVAETWNTIREYGKGAPYIGIGGLILWIFLQIFLCCAAGHKRNLEGRDEIVQGGIHQIPFDLLTVLAGICMILVLVAGRAIVNEYLFFEDVNYYQSVLHEAALIFGVTVIGYSICIVWLMSLAIRVKKKNLWSGMFLVIVLRWIGRGMKTFFEAIPQMWKQLALIVGITLGVNFVALLAADSWGGRLMLSLIIWTIGIVIIVKTVRKGLYERMRQAVVTRLAEGDLASPVELKARGREDQAEAANLSRLRDTVSMAVEKQMQSERLKTELITNVSHDIKTPLTSIINYVDLMKKEGDYTEKQEEYLNVLDKQSVRLKKLIEDLIEASKASTGNIKAEMMPISLGEMLHQLEGEYSEKLEKAELELVMKMPEEEIMVMADGRLLSRVFDNLFSNVIKYSQPETRVYLDLMEGAEYATVSLRNISRYPLDISENELMERFTRGDSSRHTEGSGLGLGIALSLVEIMGGRFRINIDADLFKAFVSLKKEEKTDSLTQSGKSS